VLDGEVVALDADGKPSFGALQRRMHVSSESAVRRLAKETPVTYVIFDLLWLDGHSLMGLPYTERRARLNELDLGDSGRWRVPDYVVGHGAQLLAATEQQGLEGVIAKRLDSTYEPADPVVAEDQERRPPGGRRRRLGARRRQAPRPHRCAARRVRDDNGSCATRACRHRLHGGRARSPGRDAAPLEREDSPFAPRPEDPRGAVFADPELWPRSSSASGPTAASCAPSYKGLRDDKPAELVVREEANAVVAEVAGARSSSRTSTRFCIPRPVRQARRHRLPRASRRTSCALEGRALTLKRYPNGVDAQLFYEKNAPSHRPDWVETARVGSIDYVLVEDEPTLVWLANLADLELHTSLALAATPERPTLVAFDLDPGPPATIVECSRVAELLRGMFEGLGLECFAKTSGSEACRSTSLLNSEATFAQTKAFSKAVAELLRARSLGCRRAPDQVRAHGQGAGRLGARTTSTRRRSTSTRCARCRVPPCRRR
jgi:bifunctional non-homologous end joining protein LigD